MNIDLICHQKNECKFVLFKFKASNFYYPRINGNQNFVRMSISNLEFLMDVSYQYNMKKMRELIRDTKFIPELYKIDIMDDELDLN